MFVYALLDKEKNMLLEPLSCIFRMILLNYKGEGVKISIVNNSIQYNEPSYYQGLFRSVNGDTREDLHNLYNPFLKAFEWYSVKENEKFKYFYQKCREGITKLLQSYDKGSIIHYTLNHYCKMFKDVIEEKEIEKDGEEESPLLDNFQYFWKKEEITILYRILTYLDTCEDDVEKETYLATVNDILTMKEKKVYDYIYKSSTTYN